MTYPEAKALSDKPKKLVVLLHGVGSDGHDLIGLVPYINKELPDCHFISPHGVEPFDMAPYGRQWFSLNDRSPKTIQKLAENNAGKLATIIKIKQEELNFTNQDTILIGFSQGTMIGLYLNLIQKEPFACMVGFSGRLIPPPECNNKITPICIIHGELDDVVPVEEMSVIINYLSKHNIPHTSYKIPNLVHSIDGKGLEFATKFINTKVN